jgi:hypothetical protein
VREWRTLSKSSKLCPLIVKSRERETYSGLVWFWKLVEPYILIYVRDFANAGVNMMGQDLMETQDINFNSESDE